MPPVKGSSYIKNEYNPFYHKLDAEYIFVRQFKKKNKKKTVFSERTMKNCFGGIFDDFTGKGGVLF